MRSSGASCPSLEYALQHMNRGVGRLHTLQLERGQGSYVWDTAGKKFLDLSCGIGVTNLGHCHPRLVDAVTKQVGKIWHAQVAFGIHEALSRYIEQLVKVTPKGLDNYSFVTTGAEAVEAAFKVAKQVTGRHVTVVMQGSFHGRTHATMSMTTSKYVYAQGLKPLMPGVTVVPIPYTTQMKQGANSSVDDMTTKCLSQLDDLLHQTTHPSEVCQILLEPVLGEGGYLPLPRKFVQGIRDYCTKHGILMTVDEVQTGFGRTGSMFAIEQYGVSPDIVVFAKGMGCGLPIAGIATTPAISAKCIPGTQGGTYAGNCVSIASASEVLKVFESEGILDNVAARGKQLVDGLEAMIKRTNAPVQEVRGRGLMLALQFTDAVPAGFALEVTQEALKLGLLIMNTSKFEVIRLIPALNISANEVDEAIALLEKAIGTVTAKHANTVHARTVTGSKPCCDVPCLGGLPCRTITTFA